MAIMENFLAPFNLRKVFYCYILFILNFLFQLFRLFTSLTKKKFNFDSLMNLTFIILDSAVIYLMISTITETSKAIAAFELDPRSRPPFDKGLVQTYTNDIRPKLLSIIQFSLGLGWFETRK